MDNKVRWGIIGTADIAQKSVIPGMMKSPYDQHAQISAIASRNGEKAKSVANRFGIPKSYSSYELLLADDEIDAVYIPLPNHLHVPLAIESLEAGKHVLCEKPIGLSVADAEQLAEAGRRHPRLKLMEAFMYRHHLQWQWAKQVIDDGQIGPLTTIHSSFFYYKDDPDNVRNNADWGGGGLMDIGCYPISLSRFLFNSEPVRVIGVLENNPRYQVDRLASAMMEFKTGTATFSCGTQVNDYQRVQAFGSKGRLELEIPFNPPADRPCTAVLSIGNQCETIEFDVCDQYGIQGDLFSKAILNDTKVPTPIEDSIANMKVIEAIFKSGKSKRWEVVPPGDC